MSLHPTENENTVKGRPQPAPEVLKELGDFIEIPPLHLLPSTIPSFQRLLDAPYKFRCIKIKVPDNFTWYCLTDGESLIILNYSNEDAYMFFKTRSGKKIFKAKIDKRFLPKNLSLYSIKEENTIFILWRGETKVVRDEFEIPYSLDAIVKLIMARYCALIEKIGGEIGEE